MNEHEEAAEEARFAAEIQREVFEKMEDSAASVTLWGGKADWKLAIEVGAAVLMNKPMIIVAPHDVVINRKLRAVADEIVRGDITDDDQRQRMTHKITRFLQRTTGQS